MLETFFGISTLRLHSSYTCRGPLPHSRMTKVLLSSPLNGYLKREVALLTACSHNDEYMPVAEEKASQISASD
jgi:hypothetical protein